jgi:hypothetical protein
MDKFFEVLEGLVSRSLLGCSVRIGEASFPIKGLGVAVKDVEIQISVGEKQQTDEAIKNDKVGPRRGERV